MRNTRTVYFLEAQVNVRSWAAAVISIEGIRGNRRKRGVEDIHPTKHLTAVWTCTARRTAMVREVIELEARKKPGVVVNLRSGCGGQDMARSASTWGKAWDVAVFGQIISQRSDSVTIKFQHRGDSTQHLPTAAVQRFDCAVGLKKSSSLLLPGLPRPRMFALAPPSRCRIRESTGVCRGGKQTTRPGA